MLSINKPALLASGACLIVMLASPPASSALPVRLKDTKRFDSATNITAHVQKLSDSPPQVTLHYNDGSGVWQDKPFGFVINNNNFWQLAIVDAPKSAEFVIRYDVDGRTYWDNNNNQNYKMGPAFSVNGAPAACSFVGNFVAMRSAQLDWSEHSGRVSGKIIVNNLGPSKLVGVRITADGWATYKDEIASFEESEQSGNCPSVVQRFSWNYSVGNDPRSSPCSNVSFSVFYFDTTANPANPPQYWDNNFGQNYSLSACGSKTVKIE